jgi:hypothetical protein
MSLTQEEMSAWPDQSEMIYHMTDAILDFCVVHPEWEYIEITKESHGLGMMRWKEQ